MNKNISKLKLLFLSFLFLSNHILASQSFCQPAERDSIHIKNLQNFINLPIHILGHTQESVTKKLGVPLRSEIKEVENLHIENIYDLYQSLFYDGIHIVIFKSGYSKDREFLSVVTLQKNITLLDLSVKIGDSITKIKKLFGEPDEQDKLKLVYFDYYSEGPGSDRVDFYFEGDVINKIQWQYFSD